MGDFFADSLLVPAFVLALLALAIPQLLARTLPEGVAPLMLNAFMSTLVLFLLSGGFFFVLYLVQGLSVAQILEPGIIGSVTFFGRLGLIASILWAPILLLSVASLPRKWVTKTW